MIGRPQDLVICDCVVTARWHGPLDPCFEIEKVVNEDGEDITDTMDSTTRQAIEESLADRAREEDSLRRADAREAMRDDS